MEKQSLLRVEQINANYLDNEIYKILYEHIQDISKNLPPGFLVPYEPEVQFLLHLALDYYSVVKNGSTFGQQLLSIKYENISGLQKTLYLLGNCFDYVKHKLEWWSPSHSINNLLYKLDLLRKISTFINISIFLQNGTKLLLIERILSLKQVYASENIHRHYNSKYLSRELLWNGFIEIIVYVLPLINFQKLRRTVKQYYNPFYKLHQDHFVENRTVTIYSKCAYCGENPILPYHMGCAHIFCYVCLKGNQAADIQFECPICEHKNHNLLCDRVTIN